MGGQVLVAIDRSGTVVTQRPQLVGTVAHLAGPRRLGLGVGHGLLANIVVPPLPVEAEDPKLLLDLVGLVVGIDLT